MSSLPLPYTLANGTLADATQVMADFNTLLSAINDGHITTVGTIVSGTWQGAKINLTYGGTNADLSATGGAHQVLQQASVGAAVTVGQLAATDISGLATVATSGSATDLTTGTLPPARLNGLNQIGAVLGSDVALNNTGSYFTGPSIAQGSTGIWDVTGCVTVSDTALADFNVKIWDGTTVVASGKISLPKTSGFATITLNGTITSPAGDLRISVQDLTSTGGSIKFNASGNSKDSYIVAHRIA